MARVVLCTFGSLGDLHPYLAVAQALVRRGHTPVLATHGRYRSKAEELGIAFHTVRPELPEWSEASHLIARWMDRRNGTERIVREFVLPALRESYDDTLAVSRGADLLVSHPLTFTTRLVAEKTGVPWVSSLLQPIGYLSALDPPALPNAEFLPRLRRFGVAPLRFIYGLGRAMTSPWVEPVRKLRADLGLPQTHEHPLFEGQHSPRLGLALFSRWLAEPQPDWPPNTVVTGFPFYSTGEPLDPELERFLDDGPAPLVFTLGSSAVHAAGDFYAQSARAAELIGHRAVLLVGPAPRTTPSARVFMHDYAPHSLLFPRAAAVIHQGGVGTTGEAMRAGRPQLIVPFSHDQPDNAQRIVRRGIGQTLRRNQYDADAVARRLGEMLGDEPLRRRAEEIGALVRAEDGAATAARELGEAARRG